MTEKVKIVIDSYFLLPDFKSRGHPTGARKFLELSSFGHSNERQIFQMLMAFEILTICFPRFLQKFNMTKILLFIFQR